VVEGEESSSGSEDDDMGVDGGEGAQGMQGVQQQRTEPRGPIVDDDGFQLVQTRKPGRTR